MKRPNHERKHRPKQQPHAVLLIILMSSICKLPKKVIDIIAAGNLATAILSTLLLHLQNIYRTTDTRQRLHHYNQYNNNQNQNINSNRNSNSHSQYAQIQQSSPSHERIVVKPNLLATNLVNTLMISLYITLFVSLSIYPVSVVAVTPKYDTAYACEEKTLTIGCEPGYVINLIRANYGRFSITICNDQGNVDWSVNCMSAKSLRVLYAKCSHKQNCSILASTNTFGDPCPGTHKYLEAHYQCVSAAQATSTTARPSPAWLITSQPSVWGTSTIRYPTTARIRDLDSLSTVDSIVNRNNFNVSNKSNSDNEYISNSKPSSNSNDSVSNRPKSVTKSKVSGTQNANHETFNASSTTNRNNENASVAAVTKSIYSNQNSAINLSGNNAVSSSTFSAPPKTIHSENGNEDEDSDRANDDRNEDGNSQQDFANTGKTAGAQSMNTINNNNVYGDDTSGLYCGSTTARNLFWNYTRVGEINVQPCPPGSTGIAKWRCSGTLLPTKSQKLPSLVRNQMADDINDNHMDDDPLYASNTERGYMWQPNTPDLTQCRSLWLNSLEVRVNQRDSALVSIANDLSQVTNSKTLYGGDMLVTTKIIQSLCEKMTYDIETFSDQRQRESVVLELLNSVVKTGSNLLDETQQYSWMDLSFEDQMRVATSLLTGLEDNAFLLADTIAAERNVVQKVKNILLSVRVLETRNIVSNQVFPDKTIEQETNSEDSIELPRGALLENSEGGLVRIVFVAFDRLESILRPLDSATNEPKSYDSVSNDETIGPSEYAPVAKENVNTTQTQQSRVRILNSKVISASLGKGRHIQLSQPIRLILKHLQTDNVTNPTCVFWNYIDHAWSEDGCHIDQTNRTHTICMCNHLTNFAILMDVIDDTAQFIQQIGLFDENMRILISISIAICIVFVVIALLTLKFFNGIFIKVRTQNRQQNGQDTLQTNSIQLSSNNIDTQHQVYHNHHHNNCNSDVGVAENAHTCQSMRGRPMHNTNNENPQNVLTMPNNDCTISAVNSLSERIPLQNYQHFHHHYHHHFHLPPMPPQHGNAHNHFVFNSNVFNANTVNSANVNNSLGIKIADNAVNDGNTDDNNLIMNLRKGGDASGGDGCEMNLNATDNDDNTIGGRMTVANTTITTTTTTTTNNATNENFSMTRMGNPNNFIARGHLQGHLHSHYPRYSQQIV